MGVLNLGTLRHLVFNSLIGEIAIVWDSSDDIIKQIVLPDVETRKHNYGDINFHGVLAEKHPDDYIYNVISDIKDVILGNEVKFDPEQLDLSQLTDFQCSVLLKQNEIPHGKVTTYKKLAELVGRKKSARPVANVLANNPFPIVIPCHRTLRSDWTIGGYNGTTDGTIKKLILENEGVKFVDGVAKKIHHYPPEDIENEDII